MITHRFAIGIDDLAELIELVRRRTERPEEALCMLAAAQVFIFESCAQNMSRQEFVEAVRDMLASIQRSPDWAESENEGGTWH